MLTHSKETLTVQAIERGVACNNNCVLRLPKFLPCIRVRCLVHSDKVILLVELAAVTEEGRERGDELGSPIVEDSVLKGHR